MIRQLTTQHSQEKWREKQVRSTKDVYLHLSRSALNFAAFLAQMSFELILFLDTPLCLSFLRCIFSPGLRGSCVRNFDQTFRFNKDSCSRVDGRFFFNPLRKPKHAHIRSSAWPKNGEVANHRNIEIVQIMVRISHHLGGLFAGGVR